MAFLKNPVGLPKRKGMIYRARIWMLLGVGLVGLAVPEAAAQEFGRIGNYEIEGVPYRVFTKIGEPTVQVYVVGQAGAGLYEVGASTDMVRLFTFAGGAVPVDTRTLKREVTVRLYRLQGGTRQVIYEAPALAMLEQPGGTPALQDGDVMVVEAVEEAKNRFTWREAFQIVSTVASLVLLVERFRRL